MVSQTGRPTNLAGSSNAAVPTRAISQPDDSNYLPGTTFFLPVNQIALYDHNSRLLTNPEKQRIKASIEASGGLTTPLVVTKRPDADAFMVQQGGNTRLEILQELAAAAPAEDTRFDRIKVVYEAYTTELDIAVNHDRENNLRGALSFIEQAKGKRFQYELFAAQADDPRKANVKAFTEYMANLYGDDISPDLFSRMRYATDVLYEWIPTILVHGRMTLGAVRDLIAFRNHLCSVWTEHGYGDKRGFEVIFYELLGRQDREFQRTIETETLPADAKPELLFKIDYNRLRLDFQNELSEMDGVPDANYQTIGLWIGAALNSSDLDAYEALADLDTDVPATVSPEPTAPTKPPSASRKKPEPTKGKPSPAAASPDAELPTLEHVMPQTTDVKSLRGRCYTFAMKIAQRNGFSELIVLTANTGHGFVVKEILPDFWWDTLSTEELHQRKVCWWLLVMCSHTLDLPDAVLKTQLPENSLLRDAWLTQDITQLCRHMGVLGVNAHLANISDDDWDDFLALITTYRQLIASANGRDNLW